MMSIIRSIAAPASMLYWLNLAVVVSLICAASLALAKLFQNRSEVFRHAFVVASLIVLLLTPLAVWVGGRAELGLLTIKSPPPQETPSLFSPASPTELSPPWEEFVPSPMLADQDAVGTEIAGPLASESASPPRPIGVDIPWGQVGFSLLLVTWCCGTLCFVFQTIRGGLLIRRHLRLSAPITEGCMLAASKSAARKAGLAKLPPVFKSQLVPVPVSTGLCYSAVILPEDFLKSAKQDELECVLIHELAHIVRKDHWVGLVQRLTAAIFWWNPLVHRICRLCSSLAEEICDDYATESLQSGEDFARTLLAMAERVVKHLDIPLAIEILPARRHDLERRITRLMQKERKMKTRLSVNHVVLVALFGLLMTGTTVLSTVWADSRVDVAAGNTENLASVDQTALIEESTEKNGETATSAQGDPLPGRIAARSQATLRLLQENKVNMDTNVSPGGLKTVYAAENWKAIIVSDLSTGVERKYEQVASPFAPVWSPDGKRIAFMDWKTATKWEGRTVSILALASGDVEKTDIRGLPFDWSRDGRFLLVVDMKNSNAKQYGGLHLVKLATGETQILAKPFRGGRPRLSPDGSYVMYHRRDTETENYDVFVLRIGSDKPIRITSNNADDREALWSADGKHILFRSTHPSGAWNLLSVAFQNGKVMGEPKVILSNLGDGISLNSCSNSGGLFFFTHAQKYDIFSTQHDPVSGTVLGEPDRLTNSIGMQRNPIWSPDGQYIAYQQQVDGSAWLLCVMDANGRNKRMLSGIDPLWLQSMVWHPDKEHVLYSDWEAWPENPKKSIYSVSIRTAERKLVFRDPNFHGDMSLSPDGKHLALTLGSDQKPQLYIVDYDGQNRRQLFKSDGPITTPIFTPDGKEILYSPRLFPESGRPVGKRIMAVPFEGGESREIYSCENAQDYVDMLSSAWLPDGRLVFDIRTIGGADGGRLHCAINVDGKSQPVKLSPKKIGNAFRMSPDGTRAVFHIMTIVNQLWLASDFLPNDNLAKK
jgi:Tol biopolymer transport system component/beta-lactamase regulating signal transducer with metallopeptidase domain